MKQARSQAHNHLLESLLSQSPQWQCWDRSWTTVPYEPRASRTDGPPPRTLPPMGCALGERREKNANIRLTWAFLKAPALTDGHRALTHGMNTERWRKSL